MSAPTAAQLMARIDAGAFAEAESLALGALATSPTPRDSGAYIDVVVMARWRNDRERTAGTAELAERDSALRDRWPGRDSLDFAWSRETLAYGRVAWNKLDLGSAAANRALAIRKARLPPENADITRLVQLLGSIAYRARNYREAVARYDEALALRERAVPRNQVEIARSRMAGGSARFVLEDYAAAAAAFAQAAKELEPTPGRDLLFALNSLTLAQGRLDLYSQSVATARRCVELSERFLGPDHLQTGHAYRGFGYALVQEGDYARACDAYAHAAKILEGALGPDDVITRNTRQMVTSQLNKSGDFTAAYRSAERELARSQALQPPDSAAMVGSINSMAYALEGMGRRGEATGLFERAAVLSAAARGPEHYLTGFQLTNLAGNYLDLGRIAPAESLLERAHEILARQQGGAPSYMVNVLRGLALAHMERGDLAGADSLLANARTLVDERLAGNAPTAALVWRDRAWLEAKAGRPGAAIDAAMRNDSLERDHVRLLAQGFAERQALAFAAAQTSESAMPVALTLAADDRYLSADDRRRVWDAVIRDRALVLDEMAARTQRAHQSDPEVAAAVATWREARERLAAMEVRGPGTGDLQRYQDELAERRRAAEQAEVALARRSAAFRQQGERAAVGFGQVASTLPGEAALVAYVRYARSGRGPHPGAPQAYLAFVLRAGGREPDIVSLGDAAGLDSLVTRWSVMAGRPLPGASSEARQLARDLRARGDALRQRIWDPLAARLGDASLVLIVPDGLLHRVAFTALPVGRDRWMVESGPTLHLLTAERDVVMPQSTPTGAAMLAVGDPSFDAAEGGPLIASASPGGETAYRGGRSQCAEFSRLRFLPLPGSRDEAEAVAGLWKESVASGRGELMLGGEATESAIKAGASGRRVLHLATHGFFLDTGCAAGEGAAETRGVAALAAWEPTATKSPTKSAAKGAKPAQPQAALALTPAPARATENPLLLSGLALAGANRRDSVAAGQDDGILTADEIASLDLSGTEWAVLSACRTGVGPIAAGEGVLGLRRAFQVAGARTVIASLWSVGDRSARRWMEALYRARFVRGLSTAEAVRAASLEVLREQRAAGAVEAPLEWAAFQAAGDWR